MRWIHAGILIAAVLTLGCDEEERHNVCTNAAMIWGPVYACEALPILPCDLVDQYDGSWPCACAGPGLQSIHDESRMEVSRGGP